MSTEARREAMIALLRRRGIGDERVLSAMGRVPRERFVPPPLERKAYDDGAFPIGFDQTISQPTMVAIMCNLLEVGPGDRVLDVGTGSGYAAAVLATMGCEVVGIELRPELVVRAGATLAALGLDVDLRVGDGALGVTDAAPFAGIVVAAAATAVPRPLLEQLAEGGRLVMPLGDSSGQRLVRVTREGAALHEDWHTFCQFVPLVADRAATLGR